MLYEFHLTTRPLTPSETLRFTCLCRDLGGKAVLIALPEGVHTQQPMLSFVCHEAGWTAARARMVELAQALSAHRPGDRPMALDFRTIGLTALVETGGRIVVNPGTDAVLLPRPAVAALAQGDEWLPAWRDEALRELLLAEASAACAAIVDVEIVYAGDGLTRVLVSVDRASFAQGADASAMKETLSAALNALGANPRLIAAADRVEIAPVLR